MSGEELVAINHAFAVLVREIDGLKRRELIHGGVTIVLMFTVGALIGVWK